MARTKNENTPEDGVQVATTLEPDERAKLQVFAMIQGHSTVSDYLRVLIRDAIAGDLKVTVGGKDVTPGSKAA